MSHQPGRHFLQIPGPTNVPLPILAATARPVIDHRSAEFGQLGREVLAGIKTIFKTENPVLIYAASGTGGWESALVNTLQAGDRVLMYETGHFAALWERMARKLSLKPEFIRGDWRSGVDVAAIEAHLAGDRQHGIKAVCIVHNETATGTLSDVQGVRAALDRTGHPALLMVDTISSLGSTDYRHDAWGVDVTVGGSQKGLMLPPGLAFNAVSDKALAASRQATLPRAYWDWEDMLAANRTGYFPQTPAINLLYGLKVAIETLHAEGLDAVFARHARAAAATRAAVRHWGFETQCAVPAQASPTVTTVRMPEGHSADAFRALVLERFNMALGSGLGPLADRVFRIGHIGDFNDLTIAGALAGVEMGLAAAGIPHRAGGAAVAQAILGGKVEAFREAAE
ncbi:Serine--glyoxylate transaminase [Methylobacterium sp. 4-46]|uniref:pyridoxal-phosphate-dependent aminotransferase family protein n=1 Tax=unclassified Methylobacterium TaxID=2615210 RepID=UPI000152DCDA|nr:MULTISPECIES: aminotransferase class V-fold PLP-dependent enzyme [Methylobacterium]ACA18716.1 Serine--glyoxylate transaminase [Methylobacterium sp. 4-46]WFT77947.1 aminotransferase class V-fold PLP-dependent enzyme [Methylobacterium nodulans]